MRAEHFHESNTLENEDYHAGQGDTYKLDRRHIGSLTSDHVHFRLALCVHSS